MRLRQVAMLLVALGLLLAACGGATSPEGVASLETPAPQDGEPAAVDDLSEEEAMLAFAQCMRDNGIDMEDPTVDAEGNLRFGPPADNAEPRAVRSQDGFEAAFGNCESFLAAAGGGRFSAEDRSEIEDRILEFAQCMRDNGFDMPDPDFGSEGGRGFGLEIDPDDPSFAAAQEACEDILGGFGPGGRGGRGGGSSNG